MQKLKQLIEEYSCEISVRRLAGNNLLAVYSYAWGDATLRWTLRSEVAESLQEPFALLLRSRGLRYLEVHLTEREPYAQDILIPDRTSVKGRRWEALLPEGTPRYIRVYDNEGRSIDQYTVLFTSRAPVIRGNGRVPDGYPYLAMSSRPFHPQGFCQHGVSKREPCDAQKGTRPPAIGRRNHLGKRITFDALPLDCRRAVFEEYLSIWNL